MSKHTLRYVGLIVLTAVSTVLLYSLLYTTYKAVMIFYRAYQAEDALNARYGLWGTIALALFDTFSIPPVYDLYKAVFRKASRLIPINESCKYQTVGESLKEGFLTSLVIAFIPLLFYYIYALVIRNIRPGHPYFPYMILTTIAIIVLPALLFPTKDFKFVTEAEYLAYVQACSKQKRLSQADLFGQFA